jgi:hypothetical protein
VRVRVRAHAHVRAVSIVLRMWRRRQVCFLLSMQAVLGSIRVGTRHRGDILVRSVAVP